MKALELGEEATGIHSDVLVDESLRLDCTDKINFRPKSRFIPQIHNEAIEIFEKGVKEEFRKLERSPHCRHNNLTPNQLKAVKELQENRQIIIKKSDKGGNVVVWHKQMYLEEGKRQLSDVESYICTTKK